MSALVAAPILLCLTLVASASLKAGHRQDIQDAMTTLRLPLRRTHGVVAALVPMVEYMLAILMWATQGLASVIVAGAAAALMLAYLVMIARALTFDEEVTCSCFGTLASPTVSRATLWRNIILTVLGVLAVVSAATGQTARAVRETPLELLGWTLAAVVAVTLTVLVLGGVERPAQESQPSADDSRPAPPANGEGTPAETTTDDEELDDYERAAIPAAVVQRPGGELVTLRRLAGQQAALLLFVSEGCGPCERVLDRVPGWIAELTPVMQVEAVFARSIDTLRERTAQRVGTHTVFDPQFSAREALGSRGAPSAVLLGADGLLAGGPVSGGSEVITFVDEIVEQIHLAQDSGELAAPEPATGPAPAEGARADAATGDPRAPVTGPTPGSSSPGR